MRNAKKWSEITKKSPEILRNSQEMVRKYQKLSERTKEWPEMPWESQKQSRNNGYGPKMMGNGHKTLENIFSYKAIGLFNILVIILSLKGHLSHGKVMGNCFVLKWM